MPLPEDIHQCFVFFTEHVVQCAPNMFLGDQHILQALTLQCVQRVPVLHADAFRALQNMICAVYRVSLPQVKEVVEASLVTAIGAAAAVVSDEDKKALRTYPAKYKLCVRFPQTASFRRMRGARATHTLWLYGFVASIVLGFFEQVPVARSLCFTPVWLSEEQKA